MLIVRHLGTPNSSFLLASLDAYVCVIQYYSDQWLQSAEAVYSAKNCRVWLASVSDVYIVDCRVWKALVARAVEGRVGRVTAGKT